MKNTNYYWGEKPKDILSSIKIREITEDNFLLWVMMINDDPELDIRKYQVQIESVEETTEQKFSLFQLVPLAEYLKESRPEFYEKYRLLLE
jgi:DNA/RNA endonuclease G (NUC1)